MIDMLSIRTAVWYHPEKGSVVYDPDTDEFTPVDLEDCVMVTIGGPDDREAREQAMREWGE